MTRAAAVLFLSAITAQVTLAGDPSPSPRQVIYSSNGKFLAISDPKLESTIVFSVKQNMKDKEEIWKVHSAFPNFHLSEDGKILAVQAHDWNYVELKVLDRAALQGARVIYFVHQDGRRVDVTLDRLIQNLKKLKETDYKRQYKWGYVLGFDERNLLQVDTFDKHRILVDPATGLKTVDEDHNAR